MKCVFRADDLRAFRSRWIRLAFSQSLLGQPVRPLLRLHRSDASPEDHILPAAVLGKARWIGLAPGDLDSLEVLDVADSGSRIRVDALSTLSEFRIACEIARRSPGSLPMYVYGLSAGAHARTVFVRSILDIARLAGFAHFTDERLRSFEPDGLDAAARTAEQGAPSLAFAAVAGPDHEALARTLESFGRQLDPDFALELGVRPETDRAVRECLTRLGLADRARLTHVAEGEGGARAALGLACRTSAEWVGWLEPGDTLVPGAVLQLRDLIARQPGMRALYADSIVPGRDSSKPLPRLKPDWSPTFLDSVDYVGRPVLFRQPALAEAASTLEPEDPHPWWSALKAVGRGRGRAEIGHLRRPLLACQPDDDTPSPPPTSRTTRPARPAERATLVIPTRDRVDLLERAVGSILRHSGDRPDVEILIVDNDSAEPRTLGYLVDIERHPHVRVLRHPGPFNFPDLVNAGAAAARGDVLILLNNDCEARDGEWLDAMTSLALRPDIGAVGAILLYPDGRLQHAGVALGLGGEAGHRDRKLPADHPGNLGRLTAVHEVSAVTAACLAVERSKFAAVGGFDRSLAVAFNDIDFCLRLQDRGYRNLLTPHAVLTHSESASRGRDSGPKRARFEREAALFRERWRTLVHDDPFSHPLFSTTRFADQFG